MTMTTSGKSAQDKRAELAGQPVILLYHRVAQLDEDPWCLAVSPANFASQMAALHRLADPVPLDTLANGLCTGDLPPRPVAVTFDDGYADNLHSAQPILERYQIPATFFLATGYLGADREFWWDELEQLLLQPGTLPPQLTIHVAGQGICLQLHDAACWTQADVVQWRDCYAWEKPPTARHRVYAQLWEMLAPLSELERERVLTDIRGWAQQDRFVRPTRRALTWSEAEVLARSSQVQIGAHTVSHPALAGLSEREQRAEIRQSKMVLEAKLNRVVSSFSYPLGQQAHYTKQTVTYVAEAGFSCACTNRGAAVPRDAELHELPRIAAKNVDSNQFGKLIKKWFRDEQ